MTRAFSIVQFGQLWREDFCFLQGANPTVPGSERQFWILANGCPPFLDSSNKARQIINSIFISPRAEHYARCVGEACQKVWTWSIDTAAHSMLAPNLFSEAFFLGRAAGQAASFFSEVMPSGGFWNWPPDARLCFLRDSSFYYLGSPKADLLCWTTNRCLGFSSAANKVLKEQTNKQKLIWILHLALFS